MAQKEDDEVYAGEKPNDYSTMKKFPAKPSMWDSVKEGFQPTETRIMLDQIRKRRMSQN